MSLSPVFEKYDSACRGETLRAQSIVECRLSDWSENKVLALSPTVTLRGAETLNGEVRYGGRLLFSVVALSPEGALVAAERGVDFSHKAACADAAPARTAQVTLTVEKAETRCEGRSLILSAIVTANIRLLSPCSLQYLAGGEGVVCNFAPVRVQKLFTCSGIVSLEEEFDTDYVADVLAHGEQLCFNRVSCSAGSLDVSGEINLGVLARREGSSEPVSFERMIPFSAEIPCDEASPGMACEAEAEITSVSLSCACDEDKGRCRILAQIEIGVRAVLSRREELQMPADAFAPGYECTLKTEELRVEEPVCSFTATERISGTAAAGGEIDFSCTLHSAALCNVQIAAAVGEGEITAEGVLSAILFYSDREGQECSMPVSLPFSFPVRCDRARAGDRAQISALCCGVTLRQKKEGEVEAEGSLKMFVTLFSQEKYSYVSEFSGKECKEQAPCAISVYLPQAGATLWEVAKCLQKTPEQVQASDPSLAFPLTGTERIVVYRKR